VGVRVGLANFVWVNRLWALKWAQFVGVRVGVFFFDQSIGIDEANTFQLKSYRNLVASFAKGERFSRLPRLSNTRLANAIVDGLDRYPFSATRLRGNGNMQAASEIKIFFGSIDRS